MFILSFYAIILFMAGCGQQNLDLLLLQKARIFAENYPDKALKFIDSISSPKTNLNREQYMYYLVAHTQIYYKNHLPIEEDTLIFYAVNYYQKKSNNPKQTSLAYFYAGNVMREQKKYDVTMEYYKNAEKYALLSHDASTIGLINFNMGDLLSEQGRYRKALNKYQKAAIYYKQYPDKLAFSYSSIGRMYLFRQNPDSAFLFFHKGLKIAEYLGGTNLRRQLTESLSVAYEQTKEYRASQKYLWQSISLNTDSTRLPRYYLNFALLYSKMSLDDSTTYYTAKLKKELPTIKDNYLKYSILDYLIRYEKKNNRISTAFDYQTDRMKVLYQIMKEREKQSIYKIEKKYNYEQITKEYFEALTIKQQWIILLMGIVILGGISFLTYSTRQKNKLHAIEGKIETLNGMKLDLESMVQKKQRDLRRTILWRFDITKKLIKLNKEINKNNKIISDSNSLLKRFNTIVYGENSYDEQWETLHQAFRQARPEYSEKIKQLFPEITETEFRICILTYADFSVKEIALILQQSPNTVQTRRTSLRQKLGVPKGGDISESIDSLCG